MDRRGYLLGLTIVLLVAAVLRLVALGRFPPGLHFDEAVYGLLALDIVGGARPVFFSSYTGREPLYMYLMALLFAGAGPTVLALRLTSALIGTVTVALTYVLGRDLYERRVGLTAAALIAVHYWHLTVSRNGYPNILIPPLEALSAIFLWRAWRADSPRRLDWVLGGAFTGLVLYTYLAARFWPVFVAVFFVYLLLSQPRRVRDKLPGIALAGVSAAIVAAPLGLHFLRQPEDFTERANQVLAWRHLSGRPLATAYARNIAETARGLLGRGDPRWHYNLPGRSVFQPLVGVFFLGGVAICLRRFRQPQYALPLLWMAALALPGVLTLELQPAGQRIFGVFPAIVLPAAIGLVWAADALERLVRRRAPEGGWLGRNAAALATALVVAVIAVDGAVTVRDYFGDWVRQPETAHIFNADYAAMAELARDDLAAGRRVVLLSEHYKHATVVFLAPESADRAVWVDPSIALPVARGGGDTSDAVVYRPASVLADDAPAARWLDANARTVERFPVGPATTGSASPRLEIVRYEVAPPPAPRQSAPWRLGGEIDVWGAGEIVMAPRDEPLELTMSWSVVQSPAAGRGFALHLRDAQGVTWAQSDVSGYLSEQWRAGDLVRQWFTLDLDQAMPPGRYEAQLMLVDEEVRPLPVEGPGGGGGVSATIATVEVLPEGGQRAEEDRAPLATLGDGLALLAYEPQAASVGPGGVLDVSVLWSRSGSAPPGEVSFRLRDAETVSDLATVPVASDHPPHRWREREMLRGRYRLRLPPDLEGGDYTLQVALRDGTSATSLGAVTVSGPPHVFDPPPMAHPMEALFGEGVRLLGYDVEMGPDGQPNGVALTLYWQAKTEQGVEAKVFTHLYDANGALVAQHDSAPANGDRPLTGWLPGEVITDRHVIVPPTAVFPLDDDYTLTVGVYDPATGERWVVHGASGQPDDRMLRLP